WTGIVTLYQKLGAPSFSTTTLLAANLHTNGIFTPGLVLGFQGIGYTTLANETLTGIAARFLVRGGSPALPNSLTGLATAVQALQVSNPSIKDPSATLPVGTPITLPQGGTYITVVDDTLSLVAAYGLEIAQ